jgi:hypothetical protein
MSRRASRDEDAAQAQAHRDAMALRSRERQAAVADIGELPRVKNPRRRKACEFDLHAFLTKYFPASTGLKPFSDDHRRVIGRIERCILEGGLFVNALPRGFAKTTISENSAIWATLYGHRKFVPVFGSEASNADGNIDSIKLELSENDLIYEDFPEAIHAIRALEGKAQRCHSQSYKGALTHIEWKADTIVLPTICGSKASGGIITAHGITAASRGMKHKRPDGTQQRPDFVIIDDPQTDESASSELQVTKRLDVIRKSILKLGGHNRRIAAVINATVIQPDDMIDQLLSTKKFPSWQGERIKMVRRWSKAHETLWLGEYQRIRNTFDAQKLGDQQRAHRDATQFYREHRREMDDGCDVSWSHCFVEDVELSAIQHAYNSLIDDGPEVFASECQNEPIVPDVENATDLISADAICEKLNHLPRGKVPQQATRLVAYIDVQKKALPWLVCAFDDQFGGSIVDYGTWPDQERSYFSINEIPRRRSIAAVTKADSLEAQIYAALEMSTSELCNREWQREDGAQLKIEKVGIDANWGESTDVVYQFCRQSPFSALLVPGHGKYVGATSRSFNDYQRKPGDRVGVNWRMPTVQNKRSVRYLIFDANYWKSFVHSRLCTPMGGKGCLSLFGHESQTHRLIADHFTSEQGISVEAKGRKVVEFKLKPTRPDNHWLDCIVGCHVLGSMQGASLIERREVVKPVRVTTFAEAVKNRKIWGAANRPPLGRR